MPFGLQLQRMPRHLRSWSVTNVSVTVGKFKLVMRSNSLLPDIFKSNPDYSSELGRVVAAALSKYSDLRVIDVGANFGDSVAIVKSSADIPVLCVEGDEQCLQLLKENAKQFRDVSIYQLFLGERSETITAHFEKQGWNTTIVPSQNGSLSGVQLNCLDDFLAEQGDSSCYKVLKIDTEGFDCRIIRGGEKFIREVKPVITFEYNRDGMRRIGEDGFSTLRLLRDIGYNNILVYDGQGRLLTAFEFNQANEQLLKDLHTYANGSNGAIYYYDLCLFHKEDEDVAVKFQRAERERIRRADDVLMRRA